MTDERESGLDGIVPKGPLSRREFLRVAGLTGVVVGMGGGLAGVLAGCGNGTTTTTAAPTATSAGGTATTTAPAATGKVIKIGFVTPKTGALAGFGEADAFCVEQWKAAAAKGITINGTTYPVEFIVKDSQSDGTRAATVAGDLINNDQIDLMLVASTPDTVNPVADQCEAAGVPCISNDTPWQAYYFGRQKDPANPVPYKWTYHMFWGSEDSIANFMAMWSQIQTNKVVGVMFPNDADGNALGDAKTGFPPALTKAGYKVIDTGRYQNGTPDFTPQITAFKSANAEIVTGVMIPPDFANFWKQALEQGFKPKIVTVAKALLFPSAVEALGGNLGNNLSSEIWWSPTYPYKSSLDGKTAKDLADAYEAGGKEWTQPLLHYQLYEVAANALGRTKDPHSKDQLIEAIKTTKMDTIAGPVDFTAGPPSNPVPNVSKTPQVAGQWTLNPAGSKFKYGITIVENGLQPQIPTSAKLQPMQY
jgi:branched-chain amino acid transport system substrate-binding protein